MKKTINVPKKTYYEKNYNKIKKYIYDRREKIRKYIIDYKKTKKCVFCGESETCCLDFHHLEKEQKEHELSQVAKHGHSLKRIQREMDKCIIVCGNCHRKLHKGILNIKDIKY